MLLAQTDRAPERLKPLLHQVRLRSMLSTVEACFLAYPPEKMEALHHDPGCAGGGVAPRQSEGVCPALRRARWLYTPATASPEGTRPWRMIS